MASLSSNPPRSVRPSHNSSGIFDRQMGPTAEAVGQRRFPEGALSGPVRPLPARTPKAPTGTATGLAVPPLCVAQPLGTASSEGGPYLICDLEAYRARRSSHDGRSDSDGDRVTAAVDAGYRFGTALPGERSDLVLMDFGASVVSVYRAGPHVVIADSVVAPPGLDSNEQSSYLEIEDAGLVNVEVQAIDEIGCLEVWSGRAVVVWVWTEGAEAILPDEVGRIDLFAMLGVGTVIALPSGSYRCRAGRTERFETFCWLSPDGQESTVGIEAPSQARRRSWFSRH